MGVAYKKKLSALDDLKSLYSVRPFPQSVSCLQSNAAGSKPAPEKLPDQPSKKVTPRLQKGWTSE
jgi:hypothetical protein